MENKNKQEIIILNRIWNKIQHDDQYDDKWQKYESKNLLEDILEWGYEYIKIIIKQ